MSHPALNASLDHDACGVGFIAQLGGEATRDVVQRALVALDRLSHRGGVDSDGLQRRRRRFAASNSETIFSRTVATVARNSPSREFRSGYDVLPAGREAESRRAIEALAQQIRLRCLGWRDVLLNQRLIERLAPAESV